MQLQLLTDGVSNLVSDSSVIWWPQLVEKCKRWVGNTLGPVTVEGWEILNVSLSTQTVVIEVIVAVDMGGRPLQVPGRITADAELEVFIIEPGGPPFEPDDELAYLQRTALNATLPPAVKLNTQVAGFERGQTLLLNEITWRYHAVEDFHGPDAPSIPGAALANYPHLYRVLRSFP